MNMRNLMVLVLITCCTIAIKAQNYESKWTFGVSSASVIYSEKNKDAVGGAFIDQPFRFSLATYFTEGVTLEGALAFSVLDSQKYTTFDGAIRFDLGSSYDNSVPYVFIGGSLIFHNIYSTNPDSVVKKDDHFTPTLNFGLGNTFWVFPQFGLNVQLMYRFSENRFESQRSHFYPSVGLVYSFKRRNMTRRIWDFRR